MGPQQLSVAEVSVAFKFFIETGLLALCPNPQPGRPVHKYFVGDTKYSSLHLNLAHSDFLDLAIFLQMRGKLVRYIA
jgi:hypothetical protein